MSIYFHVITGLKTGGAEAMLLKLVESDPKLHTVLSLTPGGKYFKVLSNIGVKVIAINSFGKFSLLFNLFKMIRVLNKSKSKVIIGWMYHGNLVASFLSMVTRIPHIWNIRHSLSLVDNEKRSLRIVIKIGAFFSKYPEKILYNSYISSLQHKNLKYCSDNAFVVPNGINISKCKADDRPVQDFFLENDLLNCFIVGHVARYHPMKDHSCFIKSISMVKSKIPDLKVVMAGFGVDYKNKTLVSEINKYDLESTVILLGERSDIMSILKSIDLFVLSSAWGEGFPNVLLEAMCCEVPVISTDVGDAKFIVSNIGKIVNASDSVALSKEILDVYDMGELHRKEVGIKGAKRVRDMYDINKVRSDYVDLWDKCL